MKLLRYLLLTLSVFSMSPLVAQDVEMADTFRSEGKIYVVVAIVLIVLAGLVTYLFVIDRKVRKLERRLGDRVKTK